MQLGTCETVQIVGIHSAGHDTGISLWENGALLYSIETERLTRRRHDHAVEAALENLAAHPAFKPDRVGLVAVSTGFRQALVKIEDADRIRHSISQGVLHVETQCALFGRSIDCVVVAHEASHAALALHYAQEAKNALILINEGRGSFSRNSLFEYSGGGLSLLAVDPLPWFANGFGWSAIGNAIGLGTGPSVAGKAMALGGFSSPDQKLVDAILDVRRDIDRLSRAAQIAEQARFAEGTSMRDFDKRAALISSFQHIFTDTVRELFAKELARHDRDAIVLGGGCALNIVANSELRDTFNCPVIVPPAPNDAGQALGAAIYAMRFTRGIEPLPFSVYSVGEADLPDQIRTTLVQAGLKQRDYRPDHVARRLADGAVVAFAQGKAECGPRALGNRSLLAHPSLPGMKKRLSEKIKGREWFRPLAPIMRAETLVRLRPGAPLSPYMLFNYDSTSLNFPEASHIDGTARIQTVTSSENGGIHHLLSEFEQLSGENALINTSLNAGGKPIAQTTRDILDDFWDSDVDVFVFNNIMVERESV